MAKRSREVGIKHTMLTQDFDVAHWDWDTSEQALIQAEDVRSMGELMIKKLSDKGIMVEECHAVKHDKDTQKGWDDKAQQETIEYKQRHGHWIMRFASPVMIGKIAEAVGLEPQYIEKPKAGRYSYDNMLAYPIHIKYPDRYPYPVEEVITLRGRAYSEIYAERKDAWDKGRAKKQAKDAKMDIEWLEEKILTGEVKRPQVLLTDAYFAIYAQNKRRCEDAFDTYAERKIYRTMQAMEQGAFRVSVFFVTGRPGSGKSMFTDALAKNLQEQAKARGEEWEVCSVASSNPFDEYRGEEILVMDDLRGMSLTASDWLKLLDPDRISFGSARYRNKRMACRVIIINSEKDVLEFFYYLKGMGSTGAQEAMDQFLRRILARVVVYRYKDEERRVLIGDRQESEPHEVMVKASTSHSSAEWLTIRNTFDAMDMSYADALKSLTAYVGVQNGWISDEEREAIQEKIRMNTYAHEHGMTVEHLPENSENQ